MKFNDHTYTIIGKAIEVHATLGPGLLENAYRDCLRYELELERFEIKCELCLPIVYKGLVLDKAYRVDLLVNDEIVLELKAVEKVLLVHQAQILTYMRLGNYKTGLLINFNTTSLRNGGIKRYVL
jgi:GxxExxY protein